MARVACEGRLLGATRRLGDEGGDDPVHFRGRLLAGWGAIDRGVDRHLLFAVRYPGKVAIFARIVKFVWSLLAWLSIVAVMAGIALSVYWFARLDEQLRVHVERALAAKWPQLR
ncbi:MAG TPA: hypothetical protein VIY86_12900, partial [Pirellulaceae bacterium]